VTVRLSTDARNALLNAIRDKIDAGALGGKVKFYDGTPPATGGAATNLLATLVFDTTCAPDAAGGVLTMNQITSDLEADQDGIATWARITDSNDVFVYDCDVTDIGGGGDIELNTTDLVTGAEVAIVVFTLTAPNP
jgi:hypothetical protein